MGDYYVPSRSIRAAVKGCEAKALDHDPRKHPGQALIFVRRVEPGDRLRRSMRWIWKTPSNLKEVARTLFNFVISAEAPDAAATSKVAGRAAALARGGLA